VVLIVTAVLLLRRTEPKVCSAWVLQSAMGTLPLVLVVLLTWLMLLQTVSTE
jgi:hypothetical protein